MSTTYIFKGILAVGLLVLIGLWGGRPDDIRLVLFYVAPYAAAAILPAKFTDFACGMVLGTVLIELPFTVLFSFFGGFFPDPRTFSVMRATSVILAVLAVVGVIAHRREGQKTGRFIGGAFVAVAYILIAASALSSKNGHAAGFQPDPTATLGSIHVCLERYAGHHGGQYPHNLSELGPNGSQCLDPGLSRGYAGDMKIVYHPPRENKAGNYDLLMERNSWFRKSNSFYTDRTGMVHESFTSRPASAGDRVINNASSALRSIANCLIQQGAPYPRDIQHFPEDPKLLCSRSVLERGRVQFGAGHEANIQYAPKLDGGIKGFVLTTRPASYGKDGVRSYFVDETGIVRATSEDRPATPGDPPIPECEYNFNPCRGS